MKRLARCAIAASLAFVLTAATTPPPVKAPMVPTSVVFSATQEVVAIAEPTPWIVSADLGRGPAPTPTPAPTATPTSAPVPTVADAKAYALHTLGATQYACLNSIVMGESRWNPLVWNTKGSGAYGLGQAKPASKMAPYGADYMTSPLTQVKFVIGYTRQKYGSACNAARWRAAKGWY